MKTILSHVEELMKNYDGKPIQIDAESWNDSGYIIAGSSHESRWKQLTIWANARGFHCHFDIEANKYILLKQ